jgi:hypothetical protein
MTSTTESKGRERILPRKIYPSVGSCIYCSATDNLSDEHIVPYGLGGRYVLPKASCPRCAKVTSRIERDCLRTMFGDLRASLNIKGRKRRPKDKYKPRPMYAHLDGRLRAYESPDSDKRLSLAAMPAFYAPTIISGVCRIRHPIPAVWGGGHVGKNAADVVRRTVRHDVSRIASWVSFHPTVLAKMIAKIGFAFAMAEARGKFKPLIAAQIVELEPWQFNFLVGGEPAPVKAGGGEFEMGLTSVKSALDAHYLMARIRFFGALGTPVYYAVVGELQS